MAPSNTFHKKYRNKKKFTGKRRKYRRRRTATAKRARTSRKLQSIVEMRRRASTPRSLWYPNQGPQEDENFYGLATTQSINVIIDPLNYGWTNAKSSPGGIVRDFRGKDIFIRYWKMKYKFDFPQDEDSIRSPMRLQLIHGFCTNPTQYTPYTTPKDSTVTQQEYANHVLKQIEDGWNSPDDQLEFRVKNKSNLRVLGKQWIRPDRTARIGLPQQYSWATSTPGGELVGGPPDVTGTLTWPMNRKYRFEYTSNGENDSMNYNNQNWIPFVIIYNPDFDSVYNPDDTEGHEVPEDRRIQFQHNSCVWYQDP